MAGQHIKEIVELPLTGLRYSLSDKLLRVNAASRYDPVDKKQFNKITEVLEENGARQGQMDHFKNLFDQLRDTVGLNQNPGEIIWEMVMLLRMIQAEDEMPELVKTSLDRVMTDWQGSAFPKAELDQLLKSIRYISEGQKIEDEILNASTALLEGLAPEDPDLSTPEKQLLWAAHLLFLVFNPEMMQQWASHRRGKGPLNTTQLWRQITRTRQARYLRALYGSHIFNLLRNNDLLVGWGAPGSWFSFALEPAPGRINCDLLYSLLAGFDHSRACVVHEIGHAVQTKGVPDYIQELSDAIPDMDDPMAMHQELRLKQYFLNACEDNCVNRFTQQIGGVFGQDYGHSLNHFYTSIGDVGRRFIRQREVYGEPTPENKFKNLSFIISRVFLANNGLFENTPEGWASVMAHPEWVIGRDRDDPEKELDAEASFTQLLEMCEEVEHYFPPLQELAGGPKYYAEQATTFAERRFDLIHEMWALYAQDLADEILNDEETDVEDAMDKFDVETNTTPPPPKKKQQDPKDDEDQEEDDEDKEKNPTPPSQADQSAEDDSDEDLEGEEATEEKPNSEEEDEDDSGEEGEDESAGEGGEGEEEMPDQGESEEPDDEEGSAPPENSGSGQQSDPTEKPEQQDKEEIEDEEGQEQDREEDRDKKEEEQPSPEDGEQPQQEEEGEMQEGEEGQEQEDGEEQGDEQEGPSLEELIDQLKEQMEELAEDNVEVKPQFDEAEEAEQKVEEVGEDENPEATLKREIEDNSLPPEMQETPLEEQEEKGGDQGAEHGGGDNNEVLDSDYIPEEPMSSIGDLMSALEEADQADEEQQKEREKREERREERQFERPPKLEIPKQMSLDELASGNWDDFAKRVAMHSPVIAVMAAGLEKLKAAQLKMIHKLSKKHSLIPQGGDLRRFDERALQKLIDRLSKNEKFEKDHLNMFRKDGRKVAPTRPTRIILIDGSRSMSMGSHPLPMNKAIQEAIIDYMASRIAGYDTYITMFGPQNPIVLAKPGDNVYEIGKAIERVQGGLNTMTYLSPALMQTIAMVAYRKKFEESYVGFTNFVIYSDGDIDDLPQSRAIIEQIFQHAPKTTFDFVLITSKRATPMDVLINTISYNSPIHEIGVVRGNAGRQYPMALTATYKLTTRIRSTKSGFADPSFLRSGQFKRLLQLLTADPSDM